MVEYEVDSNTSHLAIHGVTTDKAKAMAFAEKACLQNELDGAQGQSYSALDIHNHSNADDSYANSQTSIVLQEKLGGKPVACYRLYTWVTTTKKMLEKEYYVGFKEGTPITLGEFVRSVLGLKEECGEQYQHIAAKYDMNQVVGNSKKCTNTALLIDVMSFMICHDYGMTRIEHDFYLYSGRCYAVFEVKDLPSDV